MPAATALRLSDRQWLLVFSAVSVLAIVTLLRLFASELRMTAYFQPYFLACAFFGLAVGCLNERLKRFAVREAQWFYILVVLVVLCAAAHFSPLRDLGVLKDPSTYFVLPQFLPDLLMHEVVVTLVFFALFYLTVQCFVSLGAVIGRLASTMAAGTAYGSILAGMAAGWLIYAVSLWLYCPPVVLVLLLAVCFGLSLGPALPVVVASVVAMAAGLLIETSVEPAEILELRPSFKAYFRSFWAPYYHVETYPAVSAGTVSTRKGSSNHGGGISAELSWTLPAKVVALIVKANHSLFRVILNLRTDSASLPATGKAAAEFSRVYYEAPYKVVPSPERVLILGGGAGNDAAQALMSGAGHVDVVDAHDWLFKLGELHPQKPFDSLRVSKIVMDPRQFLKTARDRYDLIIFGPLESQTCFSPFSLLRTDNFIYTTESFVDAREHLKESGYVALSHSQVRNWYVLRLARNVTLAVLSIDAVVNTPFRSYIFAGPSENVLLTANLIESIGPVYLGDPVVMTREAEELLPTIDDWPYTFVSSPGIPRSYLFCLTILMVAVLLHVRRLLRTAMESRAGGTHGEDAEAADAISASPSDGVSPAEPASPPTEGQARTETSETHRQAGLAAAPDVAWVRGNLRVALLGCAFMLVVSKCAVTHAFNLGSTWDVSMMSAALTAAAAWLAQCLGYLKLPLPGWLFWMLLFLAVSGEYSFNYQAVVTVADPALRAAVSWGLPLVPVFFFGAAVARALRGSPAADLSIGSWLGGMAVGLVLAILSVALVVVAPSFILGVSLLDLMALLLALVALTLRPAGKTAPVTAEASAA